MISKPPGWLFLTVLSAMACVILYLASVPYWYIIEMFLLVFFVGLPLLIIWTVRYATAAGNGTAYGRLGRWMTPWFIVAGVTVALVADAPFWLRFTISKPSMEAYARTVTAETQQNISCRWLGLYRICDAFPYPRSEDGEYVPGSVCLIGEEWAFGSNTNFVLLPIGEPEETADDTYRHLTGHWYGWVGSDPW
ncbi:hypothetical protein ACIBO2_12565 [Nonomuraea sp. NPDC050022]|uniref:hypothetical protein n=1 Tax=unclassified Nonomuraea TaxID=2593643 RepID=UPI0033C862AE